MKIFISGSTGYFGSHFVEFFRNRGDEVLTERVDVRDRGEVRDFLAKNRPEVVLNAVGRTGVPNVDWCETHRSETAEVNVCGAINLVVACEEFGIFFAHIGSGCVYSGDNGGAGFSEADAPNFDGSFYSRTKAVSEKLIDEISGGRALQFRVRIPIEGRSHPKNVIDKLLKYDRLISVENSFTVVEDFIPAAVELIDRREAGIFNMTNVGSMDHRFFMEKYREIVDPSRSFEYMSLADLDKITTAPRSNCVLDVSKRENLGISMPEVRGRIPELMKNYKNSSK